MLGMLIQLTRPRVVITMADKASEEASATSEARSSFSVAEPRLATEDDKAAKRKRYYSERDSSKVYLYDQYARWRTLRDEMKLKGDKELAALLLDFYSANSVARNVR